MGRDSAEPTLLVFGILCAVGGLFLFTINVWAALGCIAFGIALLSPMIFRSKKINANNQAKDARYSESMSRYQAEVARIERDNADRQNKYNYEIAAWRRNYDKVRSLEVDIQSMDAEHNAAIYRATQESECKAEAAQKEAKLWKNRFAEIWPTAIKAIAAIVEKVNNTWQNLFTDKQVKDIDAAMHNARNQEERIIYAKDLMNLARPEFMRDEGDTAKQVEDIARNGLNVQKINTGVSY